MSETRVLSRAVDEISTSCLCRRVRAVSRRVTHLYDEALRSSGMTANQLTVLVAVEKAPDVSPSALGELLGMEKSTVSRTVARLIAAGWLASAPAAGGGRGHSLRVTGAGRSRILGAHPAWAEAQKKARRDLGAALSQQILEQPHGG